MVRNELEFYNTESEIDESETKTEIDKLNIDNLIYKQLNILIIGNRSTGKTELVKHILSLHDENTRFYIFTKTTSNMNKYIDNTKGTFYYELNETNIKSILNTSIENNKNNDPYWKRNDRIVIVFDDILDRDNIKNNEIRNCFFNHMYYNISIISTMSHVVFPVELRVNLDIIMYLDGRNDSISNKKKLFDNYFGCESCFKVFLQKTLKYSSNSQSLCINNCTKDYKNRICYYNTDKVDKVD